MNVGNLCTRDVVTVCARDSLLTAARLLAERDVEAVVVIAGAARRPTAIGIITDRDIVRALLTFGADLAHLTLLDVLARNPLFLNQDEEIRSALVKLQAHGVQHAAVVGPGGILRGAISQRMLLHHSEPQPNPASANARTRLTT